MEYLKRVIASSVIRSSHQGESHGGLYLVDLNSDKVQKVLDWDDCSIDWEGRGADRGLRGIAFYNKDIYIAASDEIFIFDKEFSIKNSIQNQYLKHCHEIYINDDNLYLTSTGFDSLLIYNIPSKKFIGGYHLKLGKLKQRLRNTLNLRVSPQIKMFNPHSGNGPAQGESWHINNVFVENYAIYIAGTGLGELLSIRDEKLFKHAQIPLGTHNARPFNRGILLNNTKSDRVEYMSLTGEIYHSFPIIKYQQNELSHTNLPKDHARQAFGRGLCVLQNNFIIVGSSPATISVYSLSENCLVKTINITKDIRNSIHGLEVWPFDD